MEHVDRMLCGREEETANKALEEVDIDNLDNREFDIKNPKTWSKKGLDDVEQTLRVNTIPTDSLVYMFTMGQDSFERDIDYGEVEQNIEKIIVRHCEKTYGHRLLNQKNWKTKDSLD